MSGETIRRWTLGRFGVQLETPGIGTRRPDWRFGEVLVDWNWPVGFISVRINVPGVTAAEVSLLWRIER